MTIFWIIKFVTILLVLFIGFFGIAFFVIEEILSNDVLTPLTLFGEDREIISEYWKDTISTFWQELPQMQISISLLVLLVIVIVIVIARKRFGVIRKRLKGLAKYKKSL